MKINFLLCITFVFITSCTRNTEVDLNGIVKNESEKMSGSFELSDLPQTIEFNGKSITFELIDGVENGSSTRAIDPPTGSPDPIPGLELLGPYYSSGTPIKTNLTGQKMVLNGVAGLAAGVYFCDVWQTTGVVRLPSDAVMGKVAFPNPSGYKDWTNQSKGVIWNMGTGAGNIIELSWRFYTLVVKYNSAGAAMGITIPLDGAEVKVPYYYYRVP